MLENIEVNTHKKKEIVYSILYISKEFENRLNKQNTKLEKPKSNIGIKRLKYRTVSFICVQ